MAKNNSWVGSGMIKTIKLAIIRDPRGDYQVVDLALSIKRMLKDKVEFTIVPVEAWGNMADLCLNYKEGEFVEIEGYFKNKKWKKLDQNLDVQKNVMVLEKIKRIETPNE